MKEHTQYERTSSERKSTLKEDLAEIKLVIAIMKQQIAQLESKLGSNVMYTEDDLREMAQMKKKV